jgi:hypothetical protein
LRGRGDAADVIVVKTLDAKLTRRGARNRALARKRPAPAEPGDEPEPVTVTRVTVVRGVPLEHEEVASDWLAGCGEADIAAAEVTEALRLLNRAMHAHRVSSADPYAVDVSRARARRVRLGYGAGEELVEGRWRAAYTVPPQVARAGRRRMLAPEEQTARILGGRREVHPSEDLLLRARLDLEQERPRAAALQAQAAHAALEAELRGDASQQESHAAVRGRDEALTGLASVALERELGQEELECLGEILLEMERVVRRRRHAEDA